MACLLKKALDAVLIAESEEQIGAARYERSENRRDYRNGTRERPLVTRIGSITLKVPRHREVPFATMLFDNYQRSEAALIATMIEMVVQGVSTRKIARVVEELCGTSFSKSTVSELCKQLDEFVNEFGSYCGIEGGISRSSLAEVPIPFSEKHIEGNPEKVSGRIADGTA